MPASTLRQHSLLLYKGKPARLTQLGDKKISIDLVDGHTLSVRPKDVELLHPGPVTDWSALRAPEGEVETAWELLAGEVTSLPELAELIFGAYSVATTWATWQLVQDGLYFSGTPDAILVHTAAQVAAERDARADRAAEQAAWEGFLQRVAAGRAEAEDGRFLQEVAALALGQHSRSQVLRALGQPETPMQAHALLLATGYWDAHVNPYPTREGVTVTFPSLELEALPDEPRRDLTHLFAVAIDDADSQDPDDALSWEDGRLWVHIADVCALVPAGSAADVEARGRGANLYLPEGTVPMLPPQATPMLALGLQEVSPAFSFGLQLGPDGEIDQVEMVASWVRVQRASYYEVEARLAEEPYRQMLGAAERYQERRLRQGAIEIDLPEVKVRLQDGQVIIRPLEKLRSRDMVREAMLITGEAVARFALENGLDIPYTSQDPPAGERPEGDGPAAMFALRRLLSPGRQSSVPAVHAGLGLGLYAQCTSPLRRYLDLVVHQQVRAFLKGDVVLDAQEVMARVGAAEAIRYAVRRAERQSNQHWTLVYLLQHPDWQGEGIVIDRRGRRHALLIPELALETDLYLREELPLDSALRLRLREVDLPNLQATFARIN